MDALDKYMSGNATNAPQQFNVGTEVDPLEKYMGGSQTAAPVAPVAPPQPSVPMRPAGAPINGQVTYEPDVPTQPQQQGLLDTIEQASPPAIAGVARLFKNGPKKLGSALTNAPGNIADETAKQFVGARDMGLSGLSDAFTGKILPKFPSSDPSTWEGGALAKGAGGLLGMAFSPVNATLKEVVGKPAAGIGGPEVGERAEMVAGGFLPVAKVSSVANAARPANKAMRSLIENIGTENIPEVVNRLQSNARLSVADVSNPVRQMTQKLAVTEGPNIARLDKFATNRAAGAQNAVINAVEQGMGTEVNLPDNIARIANRAKATGRNLINPAIKGAGPVDTSNVLAHIDNYLATPAQMIIGKGNIPDLPIQNRLRQIRDLLSDSAPGGARRVNAEDLHTIQSALRREADNLMRSSSGADRQMGGFIKDVRDKLVTSIDIASGPVDPKTGMGPYRRGLSIYKDDMDIKAAFEKGMQIFSNKFDNSPQYWEKWVNQATTAEKQAAREGAKVAQQAELGRARNAVTKAGALTDSEYNQERLGHLFGRNEIANMTRTLRDERDIAQTQQALFGGSQTAMRLKANQAVDLPHPKEVNPMGKIANLIAAGTGEAAAFYAGAPVYGAGAIAGLATAKLGDALSKAAHNFGHNIKTGRAQRRNLALADLVAAEGTDRQTLINALQQHYQSQTAPSLLTRGKQGVKLLIRP